jgi:hypothetical protein
MPRLPQVIEEFTGGSSTSGAIGMCGWSSSFTGAGSVAKIAAGTDRFGVYQLTTGALTNDISAIHLGDTATRNEADVSRIRKISWIVRVPNLAGVAVRIGVGTDMQSNTFGTDGAWLQYDSSVGGTWYLVVRSGGSSTLTDTGVAATTTWAELHLWKAADESKYAASVDTDGLSTAFVTGPAAATMINIGAQVETLGAAARTLDADRCWINAMGTRRAV